ncbi:drug/metabolite transporter (DMT)-like permease [Microvirga flocculans]|uniref:Drug/metabolite transporter (DMT)-like permease n=1 Tax=Microvirga flocculans TaxID=217168 RepID=A0A7W6N8F2_9HYPH|nr:DMT family transporter [Microvirga flocculans]MBB4040652.1 drug/metabolite transporter (DMT)-like permease [Microvirga flocculans]
MSAPHAGTVAAMPAAPTAAFVLSNLLICSFLWGSSLLLVKLSGNLSPFVLAAMRGLIGAASLALWFAIQGKSILPQRHEWRIWAVLGTLNGWLPNVLIAYALTRIPTAPAGMIQASSPLIVATLSHLLFADERLTPQRLAGVLVGFAGMGILIGPAALPDSGIDATGVLIMVAVAFSYASANIYVRTVRQAVPARMALGQQICSGLVASLLALTVVGPDAFASVPSRLAPLLALGVLSTALPILLFMHLIHRTGPTRASMVGYLVPIWTTIMAVLFLDESIGWRELTGGAVVMTGVALVSLSGRLRRVR